MDVRTFDAYTIHAREIATRQSRVADRGGGVSRYFTRAFGPDDRILDMGAGAGRDLALLVASGRVAYGIEPVAEMRNEALSLHPELEDRLLEGSLPDALPDLAVLGGPFDGVLCSAVLQHVPRPALLDALRGLGSVLRSNGRALLSVPTARLDVAADGRDEYGRLFNGVQPDELVPFLERVGFRLIQRWEDEDSLGRSGTHWATLLVELCGGRVGA